MKTVRGSRVAPVVTDEAMADAGASDALTDGLAAMLAEVGTDPFKWASAFMANVVNLGEPITADNVAGWFANALAQGMTNVRGVDIVEAFAIRNAINDPGIVAPDTLSQFADRVSASVRDSYANEISFYNVVKEFNSAVADPLTDDDNERIAAAEEHFGFEALMKFKNVMLVHPASVAAFAIASENNGHSALLASIPTLRGPTMDDAPTHDELFRIDGVAWSQHIDAAKKAGRDEHLRAGLNDTGDVPVLDLAEANAVEFEIDQMNKVWLNVDGRMRTRIGHANIIVVIDTNNRTVLRSPATAATPDPEKGEALTAPDPNRNQFND